MNSMLAIAPHNSPTAERDYRSRGGTRNDRGRRLDHIWVTPDLQKDLKAARIRRDMRAWTQPSDHVAVILDFA